MQWERTKLEEYRRLRDSWARVRTEGTGVSAWLQQAPATVLPVDATAFFISSGIRAIDADPATPAKLNASVKDYVDRLVTKINTLSVNMICSRTRSASGC